MLRSGGGECVDVSVKAVRKIRAERGGSERGSRRAGHIPGSLGWLRGIFVGVGSVAVRRGGVCLLRLGGKGFLLKPPPSSVGGSRLLQAVSGCGISPPLKLRRGAVFFRFFGAVFVCPFPVCHYPAAEQRVRCKSS